MAGLTRKLAALDAEHPGAPVRAMVLNDAPKPVEPKIFLRGDPARPGRTVPRRFLRVLSGPDRAPFRDGSGRLELARAIASPDNPLTARVMVNRIWMHHFGRGLVNTPGDFGLRSDPPTHPELLDWLARRFVEGGWSVKGMHRLILLSSTYRQASDDRSEARAVDPENLLVWRQNRRRLEFEAMRDSILAVAGRLDGSIGGRPVSITAEPFSTRRTVYAYIDRQNLDGLFRTFDFASTDASTPARHTTVVPQQALFLMNSPFVAEQARHLADRAARDAGPDPDRQVAALYRLALARPPEAHEAEPRPPVPRRPAGTPAPEGPSRPRRARPGPPAHERIPVRRLIGKTSLMPHHPPTPIDRRDDPPGAAPPLGDGVRVAGPRDPAGRGGRPGPGRDRVDHDPAGGTPAAVRAQGQAGHPPVHERRAVAGRHVRPQAGAVEAIAARRCPLDLRTERKTGAAFGSPFKFKKYGQSGIEVSELFASDGRARRRHLRHPLDARRRAEPRAVADADELRRRPPAAPERGLVGHCTAWGPRTRTCPASSSCAPAAIRSPSRRTGRSASCPACTRARTSTPSTPTSRS